MTENDPQFAQILQALLAQEGGGGMEQELAAYDAMGPQGFRAHSNMGTLDERAALAAQGSRAQQEMVMQQLAQAQQLGQPRGRNYGSVAGNIAGGLGDIAGVIGGGIRAHQLQGQQADLAKQGLAAQTGLLDQKDAGRWASGTAQMEASRKIVEDALSRRRPQQATDASLLSPLVPNYFGG